MSSISAEVAHAPEETPNRAELVERVITDLIRVRALDRRDRIRATHVTHIRYGYCIYDMHRKAAVRTVQPRRWRRNAAWAIDEKQADAPLAVSMAKAYASDASRKVSNAGIQLHGGIGMTWEHDLHLYMKRAKASEVAFGDATWHRERVAASMGA